ncbi:arabinofuranosidase catalytic domain-containing protein [Dictyobacter arantiisoli]|uniref:Alpha-N-arabinofuranosidase n=1 Tax=Dictyobacter arantiisoli TaxID=2014874 RepID=A0A5A5TGE9_9CHLR|nr:arabinofuranosidase catalytic domain-containing protein [Dictyobacter arantiisoli]GCF10236.1 alpha-N-arabinofuranosidase [Dictyobacter arantiisoli]
MLALIAVVTIIASALSIASTQARAAGSLPCDLYASGGTPCVAAHSTVRALFSAYNGNLYQVRRASDNTTLNIGVLSAGGYANAAAQDSFCAGTSCVITIIYDQSGRGNNLTQAPAGGAAPGPDNLANASALPLTVSGHHVYGVYIPSGTGYRDNSTNGIATGDNAEGEYAIFDGTHYNGGCCFDYGNAETNSRDDGNGTMEAIYFGNIRVWGYGSGNGPWVMADLENGLFSGVNVGFNSGDQSITSHYVTAMVNGGPNQWAIKAGNAQSGSLTTMYSGPRPNASGYNPMHKQGAIILGTGGDNSDGADGSFFEGAMTSGYPSDATENAVQANIVAAGYGNSTPPPPTPTPTQGATPTPTPTQGATPTPTPTSTPVSGASCSVHYAVTNQWQGGFGASLTITNTSSTAINGWSLKFSFPNGQTITQLWNGTVTQSGSAVTISNVSYNGSIPAGGTLNSAPGFNGSWAGSNGSPTAFTLNGATCSVV